jgi:hypothetical protein
VSQTGAAALDEQSASRVQLPGSPATQQPAAQCCAAEQAASSRQVGAPTPHADEAQIPPAQVCGDGQSRSVSQGW